MPLNAASMSLQLLAKFSSALDLKTAVADLNFARGSALDSGTGVGQADRIWDDTRTLGASATEDLDLSGAALLDPTGAAVVFARVKFLAVFAAAANVNEVLVGANVVNGWATLISPNGAAGGVIHVRPGTGFAAWATDATGYVVTAGTGDLLHIANGGAGTGVTYDIVVIGCSA